MKKYPYNRPFLNETDVIGTVREDGYIDFKQPMKVGFVNYPRQYRAIRPAIDNAIHHCLSNGDLMFRQDLIDFEKKFAELHGCQYGIGTGSCTGAMFITLKALGIGPGDEVITVAHTYVATVDVIKACGAIPILVDVNESDMLMDMDLVEQAIDAHSNVKAIMPVHLNGAMCDMTALQQFGIPIIEDAAQSPLAERDGAGPGDLSDAACFSFYPAKVLGGYGEGGMVITDSYELAESLYLLRDHGEAPGYAMGLPKDHLIHRWGYNTILDNIDAAILNVKLKRLGGWIARRIIIAHQYNTGLDDYVFLLPDFRNRCDDVWQNYVIRTENRDELQKHLESKGIETLVSWRIPLHKQPALMQDLGHFSLPVTEEISRTCLSLPMYPELTDEEVDFVIESIRDYFK